MKYFAAMALLLIATPAFAVCEVDKMEIAREEIRADYAEKKDWCARPKREPKPGEIVIYWERDEQGRCLKQIVKQGGAER